jgi:hypothetical protein
MKNVHKQKSFMFPWNIEEFDLRLKTCGARE